MFVSTNCALEISPALHVTISFSNLLHCATFKEFYKLMRLGKAGYMTKVENQMRVAAYLRNFISNLTHPNGQKRFQILDGGDVSDQLIIHNLFTNSCFACGRNIQVL